MQVIDEFLPDRVRGAAHDEADPADKDGETKRADDSHQCPEEDEEYGPLAVDEDAEQDHVAVEGEAGFLDLFSRGQ